MNYFQQVRISLKIYKSMKISDTQTEAKNSVYLQKDIW